ncbi:MAG: glycosyltransferase [Candidatus Rokuibacteriota bacterium]
MPMRILGHVHTFNDEDVIDRSLQALLQQTRPLDAILLVDNASTDRTLDRAFPDKVAVIRHPENRGTSGTVVTGFRYALEHGFDWIWLFDADSAPHPDALEKLLELYQAFPPDLQAQVWLLASLHIDVPTGEPHHAGTFTWRGAKAAHPGSRKPCYECDVAIWTGSLYRLEAVRTVGLPNADYVLDVAECEYGYRGKQVGFRAFVHQESIVDHNIGGAPALSSTVHRWGPFAIELKEFPPIRCYYLTRNLTYFWLHQYRGAWPFKGYVLLRVGSGLCRFTLNFLLRPFGRWRELKACLRGLRDGLAKRLANRY